MLGAAGAPAPDSHSKSAQPPLVQGAALGPALGPGIFTDPPRAAKGRESLSCSEQFVLGFHLWFPAGEVSLSLREAAAPAALHWGGWEGAGSELSWSWGVGEDPQHPPGSREGWEPCRV